MFVCVCVCGVCLCVRVCIKEGTIVNEEMVGQTDLICHDSLLLPGHSVHGEREIKMYRAAYVLPCNIMSWQL